MAALPPPLAPAIARASDHRSLLQWPCSGPNWPPCWVPQARLDRRDRLAGRAQACRPGVAPCQILRKRSAADHDSEWATAPAADPLFIQASPPSAQQLARTSSYRWWDTSGGVLTLSLPRPRHLALAAQWHQPQPGQPMDVGFCVERLAGVQRASLHQRHAACGHAACGRAASGHPADHRHGRFHPTLPADECRRHPPAPAAGAAALRIRGWIQG